MPDYWKRSMRQFGAWTALLAGYVAVFLSGSLLIAACTESDARFLLYWRAFFFALLYLPFGAVSVYAMSVAWQVYMDGAPFPDNLFFSTGGSHSSSSRFASRTFQQTGAVIDHVRIWLYVLTGPLLAGFTLGDAIATFTRLFHHLAG